MLTALLHRRSSISTHPTSPVCPVPLLHRAGRDISLVLLDLHMPVLDGWSTARLMREEHGASLPIVACTAAELAAPAFPGGSSVHQHALDSGANMCLSKTLSLAQLTAALQQLHVLPHPAAPAPGAAQERPHRRFASGHSKELPTREAVPPAVLLAASPSTAC